MTDDKAQGHLLDTVVCDVSRPLVVGVLDTVFLVEDAFICPALNYLLRWNVDTVLQKICLGSAHNQQRVSSQDFGKVSPIFWLMTHLCHLHPSKQMELCYFSLWIFVTVCPETNCLVNQGTFFCQGWYFQYESQFNNDFFSLSQSPPLPFH